VNGQVLRVADEHARCGVLGPGIRYAIWVQGCPLRCRGCVSPQWIPFDGGTLVAVPDLARRVLAAPVDGVTFSGGEPFAQAAALAELATRLRAERDLSIACYTGYPLRWLRRHADADQRRLLSLVDLLIDGPYVQRQHADLRWRGSANQRLNVLTARHAGERWPDVGAGLQFEVTAEGQLHWLGVPPTPGFRDALETALTLEGPDE
jgi:anaerobic ribonucleoside-triphosphate reductase activating protein